MTNVLDDAQHIRCPSSISFAMFRMSEELDTITNIIQYERGTHFVLIQQKKGRRRVSHSTSTSPVYIRYTYGTGQKVC